MRPLGLSRMQIKAGNSAFRPPILPFKEGQGVRCRTLLVCLINNRKIKYNY